MEFTYIFVKMETRDPSAINMTASKPKFLKNMATLVPIAFCVNSPA